MRNGRTETEMTEGTCRALVTETRQRVGAEKEYKVGDCDVDGDLCGGGGELSKCRLGARCLGMVTVRD